MNTDIIGIIKKYYPENISPFDSAYDAAPETIALNELKNRFDERWPAFVEQMKLRFGYEYVDDRTDREPGNRCVVYCYRDGFLFEIVVHISRMVEYFFFWVKKHLVNTKLVQTALISVETNNAFPEVEKEIEYILDAVKKTYNYTLMPEKLAYTQVPYISTQQSRFGQATILDLVFAGTDLSA